MAKNRRVAVCALVLALLGLVPALAPLWFWAGIPLSGAAVWLALVERRRARAAARPSRLAGFSLALGVGGLALGLFLYVTFLWSVHRLDRQLDEGPPAHARKLLDSKVR